tara:strand:- start:493 stop:726 length:234 start_codon:yes stop_codon:yes gene_type:complete
MKNKKIKLEYIERGELETCMKEMPINSSIIIEEKTGGRFNPTYKIDRLVNNYIIRDLIYYGCSKQMTISEVIKYFKD